MTTRIVLAGGGLANSLIAWRLAMLRPEVELTLLEAGPRLGGNHTWSLHGSDLSPAEAGWFAPLIEYSWPHHDLCFPGRRRRLDGAYHSLTAEHLHQVVARALGERVHFGAKVAAVGPHAVRLADGREFTGELVIDGRGDAGFPGINLRWQKFVGQVLKLAAPHGLTGPLLMDATVEQLDGYRFVYLLPFAPDQLLVEDTYYSDSSVLDLPRHRERIAAYAAARGWRPVAVQREEQGVLPIVLGGDIDVFWDNAGIDVPRAGVRAALFNPTTGYSLPEAVGLADAIAARGELASESLAPWIRERSRRRWRETSFYRLLNRMLFLAADPGKRWKVLEHFYRLRQPLIERFYAGRLEWPDALRICTGIPSVPVHRALRCVIDSPPAAAAGRPR